jgi:Ca2+-binding RTX toxin-like protein
MPKHRLIATGFVGVVVTLAGAGIAGAHPPKPPPKPDDTDYYYPQCPRTKNTIVGTPGPDNLRGTRRGDLILALAGRDRADGRDGDDCLLMGPGDDRSKGGPGRDRIFGEEGDDRLKGESGDDRINGGSGDDRISGGRGDDRIRGGAGDDRLKGDSGDDVINGGIGRDRLSGGGGDDLLRSRDGFRDDVRCGRGFDIVIADRRDRVARDCELVFRRR